MSRIGITVLIFIVIFCAGLYVMNKGPNTCLTNADATQVLTKPSKHIDSAKINEDKSAQLTTSESEKIKEAKKDELRREWYELQGALKLQLKQLNRLRKAVSINYEANCRANKNILPISPSFKLQNPNMFPQFDQIEQEISEKYSRLVALEKQSKWVIPALKKDDVYLAELDELCQNMSKQRYELVKDIYDLYAAQINHVQDVSKNIIDSSILQSCKILYSELRLRKAQIYGYLQHVIMCQHAKQRDIVLEQKQKQLKGMAQHYIDRIVRIV